MRGRGPIKVRLLGVAVVVYMLGCMPWGSVAAAASKPGVRQDTVSEAYREFVLAYRLMQQRDDELAIEAFDGFAKAYPSDPWRGDALFYLSSLHRRLGQVKRSQAFLARVGETRFVPRFSVAFLQAQLHIDHERYAEAIRVLKRVDADGLDSGAATVLSYLRGVAYRELGRLNHAVRSFESASRVVSPVQSDALLQLASIRGEMGDASGAITTLKPCFKSGNPRTQHSAAMLAARVSVEQGWYDKATEYYEGALEASVEQEDKGEAVLGLLRCQIEAGDHRAAAMTFRRYRPGLGSRDLVMASYLAAVANQRQGLHDRTIGILQGIVAKSYDLEIHDRVQFHIALSWFQKKRYQRAADTLATFQEQHSGSSLEQPARFLHAMACVEVGDLDGAVELLGPILGAGDRHPYHGRALFMRARVHEQRGDLAAAAEDYERYLSSTGYDKPARLRGGPDGIVVPVDVRVGFMRLLHLNHVLERYTHVSSLADRWLGYIDLDPQTAQQVRYRRALSLIKQGRRPHALEELDHLLRDHAQSRYRTVGLYYRGLLRLSLDDAEGGLIDLAGALEATSVDPLPTDLSRNALALLAGHYREAGEDSQAAKSLMKLRGMDEGGVGLSAWDVVWLAEHYLSRQKPKTALKCLKPMLGGAYEGEDAAFAEAMLLAGKSFGLLGDYENAAKAIRQSLTLGVDEQDLARLALGRVLMDGQRYDEALSELEPLEKAEVLRVIGESLFTMGQVHRRVAEGHLKAKRVKEAEEASLRAVMCFKELTLMPDQSAIAPLGELSCIEMAELYLQTGDEPRALRELEDLRHGEEEDSPYARFAAAMIASTENRVGDALMWLHGLEEQELDPRLRVRVDRLLEQWELGSKVSSVGDR